MIRGARTPAVTWAGTRDPIAWDRPAMSEWFDQFQRWFEQNQALFWWLTVASGLMFVGTLLAIPCIVARLPADYFRRDQTPAQTWFDRHPALRITVLVLKNVLGAVLVLGGIAMLVLPGQGILSILIGVSLLNFPGKRRLELWMIRRSTVMRAINWIRRKAGKPPLQPPDRHDLVPP